MQADSAARPLLLLNAEGVILSGGEPLGVPSGVPLASTIAPAHRTELSLWLASVADAREGHASQWRGALASGAQVCFDAIASGPTRAERRIALVMCDLDGTQAQRQRDAHQHALLDYLPLAVISTNLTFEILSWSEGASRLLGYPAQAVIGRSLMSVMPMSSLAPGQEESAWHVLAARGEWEGLTSLLLPSGELLETLVMLSLMRDPQGVPHGIVITAQRPRPTTHLQETSSFSDEDSLLAQFTRAVLDQPFDPDAIQRGLEQLCQGFQVGRASLWRNVPIQGEAAVEAVALWPGSDVPPLRYAHLPEALRQPLLRRAMIQTSALRDQEPVSQWLAARNARAVALFPLYEQEHFVGVMMIEDLQHPRTWRGREMQLLSAAAELLQALHVWRQSQLAQRPGQDRLSLLAGNLAHHFNNLLVGVLANAQFALDELQQLSGLSQDARDAIHDVVTSGELFRERLQQLLVYAGRVSAARRPFDLREVVEDAWVQARVPGPLEPSKPLMASVDPALTQRALSRLLTFFCHSDAGRTLAGRVESRRLDAAELGRALYTHPDAHPGLYVVIELSHEGPSLSPSQVIAFFEPLSGLGGSRGMELSEIFGVMRLHQGAIFLDATPGRRAALRLAFHQV